MPGRDLSAELYGNSQPEKPAGRDLGAELYGAKEVTAADRVRAGAAGINRGFYSDLLGLPVDTVANVLDLGKAAIGYGTSKVTGHAPPEWTEPSDRSKVIGSSDWIAARAHDMGLGAAIDNPNPQDKASRIIHTGGRVAGASVVPFKVNGTALTAGQQAASAGMGALSGTVSGAVGEDHPEWAGMAGMLPMVAARAAPRIVKQVVRGGEAGRQEMAQRILDLQNGGVENPSVGLASGNSTIQGLENILAQTPGSTGLYDRARAANIAGMQAKNEALRDAISPEFGTVVAGEGIQNSIKGAFKDRVHNTYTALNDRFAGQVPSDQRFPINGTLGALDATTAVNPLAPQTSASFVQPRIAGLRDSILADTTVPVPGMYRGSTKNIGLPLDAIKEVRTDIGKEAASRAIFGTPEQADFKRLYAGLSDDMRGAANITDLAAGPQPNNAGPASRALSRSNNYYSNAMTRADDLAGLANRSTPEGAFKSVADSLRAGPTIYEKLRGVLTPEARQKVVATVVDDLGMATAGQQGVDGTNWSPRTFLTNFNKLRVNGGGEALFKRLPGGEAHADNLSKIAHAADMVSNSAGVWSNPSGTAPALSARAAFGTIGAGVAGGLFYTPLIAPAAVAGGSLIAANQLSKRLLLNPKFVNWLAKAPTTPSAAQQQSYAQRLVNTAALTNDDQFKRDAQEYLSQLDSN